MSRFTKKMREKEINKASDEREYRLTPVAKKIVDLFIAADLPIEQTVDDRKLFTPAGEAIIGILLENNVNYTDRHFVFQLALRNEAKRIVERYTGKIDHNDGYGSLITTYMNNETLSSIVLQPFNVLQNMVITGLEISFNRILTKLLGKDILDLTIKEMDEWLKVDKSV